VSSGAPGLEAAAVVTGSGAADDASVAAVRDLSPSALVIVADPAGTILSTLEGASA
jgi:hypothetical protein